MAGVQERLPNLFWAAVWKSGRERSPAPLNVLSLLCFGRPDSAVRTMSPVEWQQALATSPGGVIYYGAGPVFSHVSPRYVVGIDAAPCRFAILLDRAATPAR